MSIAAVSSTELNNHWMYAALRVQDDFNTAALAASPVPIDTISVLSPAIINDGEYVALSVLREAISDSLVAGTYPALTPAGVALTNIGWKYILPDLVEQANASLATVL